MHVAEGRNSTVTLDGKTFEATDNNEHEEVDSQVFLMRKLSRKRQFKATTVREVQKSVRENRKLNIQFSEYAVQSNSVGVHERDDSEKPFLDDTQMVCGVNKIL